MKLFVGNDYTFCMSEDCDKKKSCVRWKGHYEKADGFDWRAYVMSCNLYFLVLPKSLRFPLH